MEATHGRPGMGRWVQLACWLGLGWVFVLGLLAVCLHYQVDPSSARQYFTNEEIEVGLDYGFERKLLGWVTTTLMLVFGAVLVLSPLGNRLTAWAERVTGGRWVWTVLLLGGIIYLGETVLSFPFSVLSLYQRRAWGMTQRGFGDWVGDYLLSLGISAFVLLVPQAQQGP